MFSGGGAFWRYSQPVRYAYVVLVCFSPNDSQLCVGGTGVFLCLICFKFYHNEGFSIKQKQHKLYVDGNCNRPWFGFGFFIAVYSYLFIVLIQ